MSEKRFVCIDVGYGDDWYITDNGKRLYEMEIVNLLNEQQATITALNEKIEQRNVLLDKIEKALGEPIEEWLLGVKYK